MKAPELSTAITIDPENPWLGLSSYSEETRAYFHGRDEEVAELARRVQRKLLTVLFGQSGLGKTSLLRAGLVPRLRGEAFCPVYVRVDYSADSPTPSEQIKQAIFKATADAGHWTRPGSAIEGESLWEFLHHRGDLLRDVSGRTVLPLLIFDQFEEIFTLAQADDTGRLRAKLFLQDLADLVENRPPAALETRIDNDEADAGDFDFSRADYRILIALREDYLAHLESVKTIMPSITQNRMRLARMNGAQALSAVVKPGGRLVTEEVAESIVRFVAGGSEIANAEVEPSLLSLICRELNTVRQAQGREEISADLLAGSRDTILSEFYERALSDQPAGVRRVVEDELLTESGFRESLAEERVSKALAAAGAAPGALAKLVDRRLLRVEDRLDMRRVELTHDVLCSVVRASRDMRHQREARDEARRQLAAQEAREEETHRTLMRTRMVAMVAGVLMVIAGASAVFGWVNLHRARAADAETQHANALAEKARGDAERLVGFLIEDFYAELEPTGRLETMGKLAHMAVNYYDGLPAELMTPQTQAYRGMALIREGGSLVSRGNFAEANKSLDEAYDLFASLRAAGNDGEEIRLGLVLAKFTRFTGFGVVGSPGAAPTDLDDAQKLLQPLVYRPDSSRKVRLVYADLLNYISHRRVTKEEGIKDCEEARKLLHDLGARDLSDLSAASIYADTSDSQSRHALQLGRVEEAERLSREVYDVANKVLVQRPGDFRSMQNRLLAADMLGALAFRRHDYAAAAAYAAQGEEAAENYVRFNPSDLTAWDYLIRARGAVSFELWERGQIAASIRNTRGIVALQDDKRPPASLLPQLAQPYQRLALREARAGQAAAAEKTWRDSMRATAEALKPLPKADPAYTLWPLFDSMLHAQLMFFAGDAAGAYEAAMSSVDQAREVQIPEDRRVYVGQRNVLLRTSLEAASWAALKTGHYEDAEAASRAVSKLPPNPFDTADPENEAARLRVVLAHAIARQGRAGEARVLVEPELTRYRSELKRGASDVSFRRDFAHALFVSALLETAGSTRRVDALAAAGQQLSTLPPEARNLVDVRELARWVATEQGKATTT